MATPAIPYRHSDQPTFPKATARVQDEIGVLPPMLATLLTATDKTVRDESWAAFVTRYTPLLLHTVHRLVHSYDEAMDRYTYLLEQLSRNEFRRLRAFAALGPGLFSTWLVVVAHRILVDYHRQRYGRLRLDAAKRGEEARNASLLRRQLAEMIGEELHASAPGDESTDPEGRTCAAECTAAIQTAVSSLDPRDQLLLNLRFNKDLAAREIAGVMGFPTPFHVYRRLRAVLAVLRRTVPPAYQEYVGGIP
jgi:RNA polymerase sigma factor (sigma-70 family)